ncbi:MAG: single-stranded DNA-binding protein [Elusimicrobia bacterium]|nr:single-stranded DNA-binding protein [Elusimicrobiota bacterium]
MASFSKVIMMGNITKDPEVRFGPSGSAIAGFSIGINRRYKAVDGSTKEETSFVDVTFFGKSAEICQKYVKKGDSLLVEGRLKQDNWEGKDGQKRSKLVVVGERLYLMPKKTGGKTADTGSDVIGEGIETVGDTNDDYQAAEVKQVKRKSDSEVPF